MLTSLRRRLPARQRIANAAVPSPASARTSLTGGSACQPPGGGRRIRACARRAGRKSGMPTYLPTYLTHKPTLLRFFLPTLQWIVWVRLCFYLLKALSQQRTSRLITAVVSFLRLQAFDKRARVQA